MGAISIPLPSAGGHQDIEVDIRINGQLQQQNYRVEIFYWSDCQARQNRAECIREILTHYDPQWELYYLGAPTDTFIPITFVQKRKLRNSA